MTVRRMGMVVGCAGIAAVVVWMGACTTSLGGLGITTDIAQFIVRSGDASSYPLNAFLDVSQAPGAGAGYSAPYLEVGTTDSMLVVKSNGMPHFSFVQTTPNALAAQNYSWEVPLGPQMAASTSAIPLLGVVAFAVNGLPIFGPNEAAMPANEAFGDPVYNGIMDEAQGHTGGGGAYHFHALSQKVLVPSGLVAEPWLNDDPSQDEPSPVIGFALDGFAIYGPYCCADADCTSVIEMQSSWEQTGNPMSYAWNNYSYVAKNGSSYLDQCNGHIGPKGDYHYHATAGFPYVLGCYRGTP